MKVKNNKKEKRGISLIVLVITIIVIIVLAVAVILTVAKNNPIESAKKAVFLNDMKSIEEEINMYIASNYVKTMGEDSVSINMASDEMVSKFPSTEKYKEKIIIVDGKINLTESSTEEEKIWGQEAGIKLSTVWDGSIDTAWYENNKGSDTFEISKPSELAGLAKLVNDGTEDFAGKTINLVNDIDLNNLEWTPIGYWKESDWMTFSGIFNGNSHCISKARIEEDYGNCSAIFGSVSSMNYQTAIKNLIVKDSNFKGERVAAIVGYLGNEEHVHSPDNAIIENCASINNYIEGSMRAGGIVDELYDSTVLNCYNSSTVVCTALSEGVISGNNYGAGGIDAGSIDEGKIYNCYNKGSISAPNSKAGGIVGGCGNYIIYNCYNVGEITGKYSGELFGEVTASEIRDCYYLSGKTVTGILGDFDESSGQVYDVKEISEANLKLESAVELLNQNGYTAYKEDTKNINNGYPILSWQ